jgi:hypothetical protein
MTYITADELIPIAGERGHKHTMSRWNECYIETLARELKSKYERGVS